MVVASKAELQRLYSNLITLYTGFEVQAADGATVEGANVAVATMTASGATPTIKINQIGGVLFTVE
jgi:hypothetical protein